MPKPSHRDKILDAGLAVFHAKGFNASGVQDVVSNAGVPKGSFYNHFDSKEALGAAVLERYWEQSADVRAVLKDQALVPLDRLDRHFATLGFRLEGCLVGNFTAELAQNDLMHVKLSNIWDDWANQIAHCLAAGQRDASIRSDMPAEELARSVLALWEGSVLMARVERNAAPLEAARRSIRRLLAS